MEADGHAAAGAQQQLLGAVGQRNADQLVVAAQRHRDQAAGADVLKLAKLRLFDDAVARGHHQHAARALLDGDDGGHLLAAVQLQQVDNRGSLGGSARLGDLVAGLAEHAAAAGEEHQIRVRAGDKDVLGIILLAGGHAGDTLAAALLRAVGVRRHALDVAKVRQRHRHVLLLDQIRQLDLIGDGHDLGAARVGVLGADGQDFLADDAAHQLLAAQHLAQVRDGLFQLHIFVVQPLPLQTDQALQTHVQDRLRLLFAQPKARHQAFLGLRARLGRADEVDHLVDVVQRHEQAFQYVRARLGLAQVVARPAHDDVLLVLDVVVQHLLQVEHARHAAHQRQHVDAEGLLHLRVLEQRVEHDLRVDVLFQLDHDAHAAAVGLVAQVGDALHALFVHELGDLFHQPRLVHLIGDLGHHNAAAVCVDGLDLGAGAHDDAPLARQIRRLDAVHAHDEAGGGEVRPLDDVHQLAHSAVRVVEHVHHAVDHLAHVVRRDVGGHAHRDAARAVDQQVGEARGQHLGLHQRLVEVGVEVHRLLVQIGGQIRRHLGQARLGVTHRRGAVAVHGAKVALALHQRVAHREILRQTHHRVVHRRVAVGVIFTQHVAHDARALAEGLVGRHAKLGHRVEYAAMHGL